VLVGHKHSDSMVLLKIKTFFFLSKKVTWKVKPHFERQKGVKSRNIKLHFKFSHYTITLIFFTCKAICLQRACWKQTKVLVGT